MTMISNKFSALKVNVQDPFSKTARNKKNAAKSQSQKPKPNEQIKKEEKLIETSNDPIVQTKKPLTKEKETKMSSNIQKTNRNDVAVVVTSLSPKNDIRENPNVVINDLEITKDDRSATSRTHFKRPDVVHRGRQFDRHGSEKSQIKAQEKRHGHGNFNWGQVGESENVTIDDGLIVTSKPEENPEPSQPEVQYTLLQYKELLRDNKVNPLEWQQLMASVIESVQVEEESDFDARNYRSRPDDVNRGSRRGRGSRFPPSMTESKPNPESPDIPSSRGFGRGRGSRQHPHRGTTRHYGGKPVRGKEVRVDSKLDFPDINRSQ